MSQLKGAATPTTLWYRRLVGVTSGSLSAVMGFVCLGGATAHADVVEVAPAPQVTSRQALIIDDNALRATAPGEARGFLNTRLGDAGVVHAQGEVRGGVKAVTGTTAAPFELEQNGSFDVSPPIGDW